MNWEALTQFGLAGIIFGGFICVLKWVFDINNRLLLDMAEERKASLSVNTHFIKQLQELSVLNREFQGQVRDAHDKQSQQHQEIMATISACVKR